MLKQPSITQRQAVSFMENKKPFRASALSAVIDHEGNYIVYSYATVIAVVYADGRKTYLNNDRYSVTTSKHQGLIRFALKQAALL